MAFELSASVCMLPVNACQRQVQNIPCTSCMRMEALVLTTGAVGREARAAVSNTAEIEGHVIEAHGQNDIHDEDGGAEDSADEDKHMVRSFLCSRKRALTMKNVCS